MQNAPRTRPDWETLVKSSDTTPKPGPTTPRQHAVAEMADKALNWGLPASVMAKPSTEKIKISGKRYRCNMISAISNLGKMRFRVFEGSFTAEILIDFMKRLIKTANKKVFLILDNHQIHKKSKKTLDWIEAHKEEIEVFNKKLQEYEDKIESSYK